MSRVSMPPCLHPGGVRTSEAAILPYVPYPICPATESPAATRLPILQPRRTSQLGALMTDPITGIEVPVLAVTLHPQTRQWLTLGGTYCNPLTKTLAPLELGSPMEDPVTGGISPILGVGLDENTGLLVALSAVLQPLLPAWPGFPIPPPHPQSPRPSHQLVFPPTILTLPLIPTFPLLPSSPHPFPISSRVPQRGKRELSWFCSKSKWMFSTKKGHHSPSCHHSALSFAPYSPPTCNFQSPPLWLILPLALVLTYALPVCISVASPFHLTLLGSQFQVRCWHWEGCEMPQGTSCYLVTALWSH